ncbi:putative TetR family transcriptional regulator [Gordonia effusa NBRC 100432]|uniref:Putative TetR family transcriptional regulator n=1 Tax=Gordonia effusa NBRC 100432 TaxID=1077974 RepID=H0QWN3_9ACTN|nr:TetR/AcrR family transcriptional regulator [Gordonia effusa]GAB17234.1 putative TetR family transcriptional regulator [Gordonia effusa NBRC 100432]
MTTELARGGRAAELLDAAIAEFVENGYPSTGVREITARADVSHGTFYNYFDNRRQMLSVLIQREFSSLLDVISRASEDYSDAYTEESLRKVLVELSAEIFSLVSGRVAVYTFLLMEAPGVDADALAEFVELYYEAARRIDVIFQRARDAGVVNSEINHDYVSQAWVSFVLGIIAGMIVDIEVPDPKLAAKTLTGILLHGAEIAAAEDSPAAID